MNKFFTVLIFSILIASSANSQGRVDSLRQKDSIGAPVVIDTAKIRAQIRDSIAAIVADSLAKEMAERQKKLKFELFQRVLRNHTAFPFTKPSPSFSVPGIFQYK